MIGGILGVAGECRGQFHTVSDWQSLEGRGQDEADEPARVLSPEAHKLFHRRSRRHDV